MDGIDVIDQPTDEVVIDQTQDQPGIQDERPDAPQITEDKIDGRKFNPEWSKFLKTINEQYANDLENGPKVKDMLTKMRDDYARYQDVRSLTPKGLDDIRGWKTTIDSLGGSDGAATILERFASMEAIDAKIEASDFSVVGELPENLQKGFYGMLPAALTDLKEKDHAAYAAAVMPHFSEALAGTGLGTVIDSQLASLARIYEASTDPEVRAEIKSIYADAQKTKAWYGSQTSGAGHLPSGSKTIDPQVQRLQAELDQRNQRDSEAFVKGITETTNKYVGDSFTKNAEVYLNQLKLSEAQKADLMESYGGKLVQKLAEDKAFQTQLKAYGSLKNRSDATINQFIQAKIDEVSKPIMDGLVTARYGGKKPKTDPLPTARTTDSGSTRVSQAPDQSLWNMGKMEALGYAETVKKGIYHLADGRTLQLVKQ